MELNYEYDLWQFKNIVEGREELDLDWMSKMFEAYFKGYYEQEDKIEGLQEEVEFFTEETTLEDQMFMVDSELRRRIKIYDKMRSDKGFSYTSSKAGVPFLSTLFEWIDLTDCAIMGYEDEESTVIPHSLLGHKSRFEKNLKEFIESKVEEREKLKRIKMEQIQANVIEKEVKEKAEYERLKAKYEKA